MQVMPVSHIPARDWSLRVLKFRSLGTLRRDMANFSSDAAKPGRDWKGAPFPRLRDASGAGKAARLRVCHEFHEFSSRIDTPGRNMELIGVLT